MDQKSKLERADLLEKQISLMKGLPFLYGWKWYPWARDFYESTNKVTLLTAANQISKSSTQIRKVINWATNTPLWSELWRTKPTQFWYLYPTANQATIEFEKKWSLFLPRGSWKTHPQYGWRGVYKNKEIHAIHFNTGVTVYFKSYAQDTAALQTGTVDYISCFVAGTKIGTPFGERNVQDLVVGDWVHTHKGPRRVIRTQSRPAEVIQRKFPNGRVLIGTPEHPVWTKNRGWVQMGNLTEKDSYLMFPECGLSENPLKLFSSKGISITEHWSTPTHGREIIFEGQQNICTSQSGRATTEEKFQKVMSFTTRMKIHLLILPKIWCALLGQNILKFIKKLSGWLGVSTPVYANSAGKSFYQEAASSQSLATVLCRAGKNLGLSSSSVSVADQRFLAEKTRRKDSVQNSVPTGTRREQVYNIEVEDAHTYYANGILVHNCDEELPVEMYDELMHRISASDGYFSMVFTATMGQDFWRLAMEPEPFEEEKLVGAWKRTVSMYDCQVYEDGSLSHWTNEKIQIVKNRCKNDKEILRRVYGRFIRDDGGLKYEQFSLSRHMVPKSPVPYDWLIYAAVDIGSGGQSNHPSAICFLAVRPDYRKAQAFLAWRGDGIVTTSGDVMRKFQEMRDQNKLTITSQCYDWGAKDFETIAARVGEPFLMAKKSHDLGEDVVNTLFKNDMIVIQDDPELQKLAGELITLRKDQPKNKAKDDLADAFRYCVTSVPWDFEAITSQVAIFVSDGKPAQTPMEIQIEERRESFMPSESAEEGSPESEIEEWNAAYSGD